jgi:hypothetical protein
MNKVLFINHKIERCGVYQYGKRIFDILIKSKELNYIYYEVDSFSEYVNILKQYNNELRAIIYNYHASTLMWLNNSTIQNKVKNIGLLHETDTNLFDIVLNISPSEKENRINIFSIPRPIFENADDIINEGILEMNNDNKLFIEKYTDTDIPIFGSFGFGFDNKGFEKIIDMVNKQYDEAVIKFVIPSSSFDPNKATQFLMRNRCLKRNNLNGNSGITLMITHNFFSTSEILYFLKKNTMNIFLYDYMEGRGPSSTIDYAVSVQQPIGISDSYMFRHIYSDDICLYKNTIDHCLNSSKRVIQNIIEKNKNVDLMNKVDNIVLHSRKIRKRF